MIGGTVRLAILGDFEIQYFGKYLVYKRETHTIELISSISISTIKKKQKSERSKNDQNHGMLHKTCMNIKGS